MAPKPRRGRRQPSNASGWVERRPSPSRSVAAIPIGYVAGYVEAIHRRSAARQQNSVVARASRSLAGLAVAAIAPDLARRAGRTLTTEIGPTVLAGLVVWVVLPIVGGLLFAAIIGVPTALAIWLVVLPALGVGGFLISGIRLGEQMLATTQRRGHPYLASFFGLLTLIAAGVVPFLGPVVVAVAGFLGSGALALLAVRAAIRPRVMTGRTEPPQQPLDVGA